MAQKLNSASSTTGGSSSKSGSSSRSVNESYGSSDSYGTSGSSSDTSSHTESRSSSHTEGGSTSHSVGGSQSQSVGGSQSVSQNVGGNTQTGYGKSWASGQVSDRTQQKYNQATQDYVRSQNVEDAYANLQNAINSKPAFQSKFEDQLNEMYNKIMNREAFTYDFNKDAMYQQYKDMYQTQGKRAMQDTMGQLAAMNNGYGSSYAQTAGQQTYQNYLQQLNDRIPELRKQALEEYDREGNRLNQQYQLTNDAYNREYGQYRDTMSDWQADRSFNQSAYQDERNFDYNQAQNDRSFWQNEYWAERNAEQSNMNQSQGTNWSEGIQNSTNWQDTNSRNWSDTDTKSWSDTDTHTSSDTNSHTDTSGWSNSHSDSYNKSVGRTDTTGWQNTNSWSNTSGWQEHAGSGSGTSGARVEPYSASGSLDTLSQANRNAQIDQVAHFLNSERGTGNGKVNQKELGNMVVDLLTNGTKIGNKTVTYTPQDIANMMNEADARNNRDSRNGSTYHMNNYTARDIENIYNEMTGANKNGKKNTNYWG